MTRAGSRLVAVVGDVVLDRDVLGSVHRVSPDAPVPVVDVEETQESPGGAGLAAAVCAADPGVGVRLLAPIAGDAEGAAVRAALERAGVEVHALGHDGRTRTRTRVRAAGQSLVRLDGGGPGGPVDVDPAAVAVALAGADAVLVADYGAGCAADPFVREALADAVRRVPVVWDPHPRGPDPVPGCLVVTPNLAEATGVAGPGTPDAVGARLAARWGARGVAVTTGAQGAWLARPDAEPVFAPAPRVDGGDPCGAGDRFATAVAVALAAGAVVPEAVVAGVAAASAWVGAGGAAGFRARLAGAAPAPPPATGPDGGRSAADVLRRVRGAGGTLVATGGCFDVLHAGHVASLEAARRLGDALVVLLNSDASVRRLKGPGRPVTGEHDRARVLAALDCVDAVVVFDEDDPRAALDALRPDVWAKGGDYDAGTLPEAPLVRSWGGRVVVLPYLEGRSTTALLARGTPVG